MSGFVTGTDFDNAKIKIKEGQTAEDILKDITDTETLQKISDAILIDKNFLLLEEYNKFESKKQLYRLGHLSKAKSLHAECNMEDLVKAMEAFNTGKKRISGGNSPEEEPEEKPEEEPEADSQPEAEEEQEAEPSSSDDVKKTFQEIGSQTAEITNLLRTQSAIEDTQSVIEKRQSAIEDFKNKLSTNMQGLKELTDNIKGKSMECLQTLAMSLFGLELQNAADKVAKVASVTGTMALGAAITTIPSYPNEVGDIIFTVFKYSTLSVKYFIKLYITYIIGALAKSGLESGSEDFKNFMGDTTKKLLQIATAASVDIAEVQKIFKEYIPTVITNEIKKITNEIKNQQMTDFMEAVQEGLQKSVEERNNHLNNVNFQSKKSFPEIPVSEQEKIITSISKVGELSESRLVQMIETEGLDENIKQGLEKKLEKMTGKRKRGYESDDDKRDDDKRGNEKKQRPSGGNKRTRKQKKNSKKQKKHSKNKSKKQKKNKTKKTHKKNIKTIYTTFL